MGAIDNYFYLNAGVATTLKGLRGQLEDAYSKVDTDAAAAKQQINEVYKGLQYLANGLNHVGRQQGLGDTAVSGTAPAAPCIEDETVSDIE